MQHSFQRKNKVNNTKTIKSIAGCFVIGTHTPQIRDIRQQKPKEATSSIQTGAQGQWLCTEHDLHPRGGNSIVFSHH